MKCQCGKGCYRLENDCMIYCSISSWALHMLHRNWLNYVSHPHNLTFVDCYLNTDCLSKYAWQSIGDKWIFGVCLCVCEFWMILQKENIDKLIKRASYLFCHSTLEKKPEFWSFFYFYFFFNFTKMALRSQSYRIKLVWVSKSLAQRIKRYTASIKDVPNNIMFQITFIWRDKRHRFRWVLNKPADHFLLQIGFYLAGIPGLGGYLLYSYDSEVFH